MRYSAILVPLAFSKCVASQQIWDIWQTTWDRGKLFTSLSPSTSINFVTPTVIGSADIVITDTSVYQTISGFGGSLTDSSAQLLNNLKATNSNNYWTLLNYLFSPTDGANSAGLSYVRVPLAASDFSAYDYSFDDSNGDTSFNNFNIHSAPSYLFSVLKDIQSVNSILKVHVLPWSPPAWMKTSGSMNGGSLQSSYLNNYATYLLKCLQGFQNNGINVYAISIQNEVENSNPTYPSTTYTPQTEGQVGTVLRALMNSNGFGSVKLIGYEHNWVDASAYPVQLMQAAGNAYNGVAFHCYQGSVDQMDSFHSKYPSKEIYFTECSGTIGSDWWSDIKWYMTNIFIGAITHNAQSGLMWNIALDGNGNPELPGSNSCSGGGCRGIVQVNSNGTYSVNQEFYAMAQASKAVIPKDVGGPWGQRIGVSIGGQLNWALTVGAFVTGRVKSTDWQRYSIVVLNSNDNQGGWNPTPVQTTIEFRGMQATYTFPVGVTTLWWYAPASSLNNTNTNDTFEFYSQSDSDSPQKPLGSFK